MRVGRNDPCPCGSGLTYELCCSAEPERRAALIAVQDAAAFLPALRPEGDAVLRYCSTVADDLGENEGNVPDDIVERGLGLVDEADRAAIVSTFSDAEPEAWEQLASIAAHAECELVRSALRGAICDRRPVARTHLAVLETDDILPDEIGVRLGAVLPSGAVWSRADAEAVLPELPAGFLGLPVREPKDGPLLDRVEDWHVERVRLLCDALCRHLPLRSLPRASRIVSADCEAVLRDDAQARRTAAMLLLSHASMVAASADEAFSPN